MQTKRPGIHVADQTYARIRAGILDGEYAFGARLGEAELAAALGVSRTPIREALRRLGSEGLVELLPNRGARVGSWTSRDLVEIYELRALLESHGAALACARLDGVAINRMEELCVEMELVGPPGHKRDLGRLADLNQEFHAIILRAADNNRLSLLLQALVEVPLVLRTYQKYSDEALRRSLGHHRELVAAMRAANPVWAGAVMRSHVLAACDALTDEPGAPQRMAPAQED